MNTNFSAEQKATVTFSPVIGSVVAGISILLALGLIWYVASVKGGWPIKPMHVDHPVATTLGEVLWSCNVSTNTLERRQHAGVDILASHSQCLDAPDVVNIAEGYFIYMYENPASNQTQVHIIAKDCKQKYLYVHLDSATIPQSLKDKRLVAGTYDLEACTFPPSASLVFVGDTVGKLEDAFVGDNDHLHLQVEAFDSSVPQPLINGLAEIWPNPDTNLPDPVEVHLAQYGSDPWDQFEPSGTPDNCTVVQGDVDIIVRVGDRDDAGSAASAASNVFIHDVVWQVCPEGNPGCGAWRLTHRYGSMSDDFSSGVGWNARFSDRSPWITTPDHWTLGSTMSQCTVITPAATYMILGNPAGSPSWRTTQRNRYGQTIYPNGRYLLTVKATGIDDVPREVPVSVCVQNPG